MGWVYPVPGANVSQQYHVENDGYAAGYHTGIDWSVAVGTGVQAAGKGTVTTAGWSDAYGNYVIIRHPNGFYSLYAHLSRLGVSVGDRVGKGEQIGLSGNTGNSHGPHLHFEVRETPAYGSDVNPLKFFGGKRSTGGHTSEGPSVSPKKDNLSREELAEQYGWAMSFLKSNDELWDLFQKAVKGTWSSAKFAAELRDTRWYKKNSESVRKTQLLKTTDPASYRDRLQELKSQLSDMASAMGAKLSKKQLDRVAENALMFGWNEAQVQNTLADYVKRVQGSFVGEAGTTEDALNAYAKSMGVRISGKYVKKAVENIAAGRWDENVYKDYVNRMAMSAFPTLRDDIKGGSTVEEVAAPYIQSAAALLEKNPADVDLFDPMIRRALMARGEDGKPAMKSLWEFEQDVRKTDDWLKTKNASDEYLSVGRQILSDMGLSY